MRRSSVERLLAHVTDGCTCDPEFTFTEIVEVQHEPDCERVVGCEPDAIAYLASLN